MFYGGVMHYSFYLCRSVLLILFAPWSQLKMASSKLFLIQSNDPSAASTKRWKVQFDSESTPLTHFLERLADFLHLSNGQRVGMGVEVFDSSLGNFQAVNDDKSLWMLLSDVRPTQMLVKYKRTENDAPMIKGRAFDTSKGLFIRSSDGKEHVITLQEPGQAHLGTGLNTWDGSIVLAKYLERHAARLVEGKKILELGAGTGIAGMSASVLGASFTVLTDLEYVLENLKSNVRKNIPQSIDVVEFGSNQCRDAAEARGKSRISVQKCDWMDSSTYPLISDASWDVIIGADIVWIESLVPSLVETLNQCASDNTLILISHQVCFILIFAFVIIFVIFCFSNGEDKK